VGAGPARERQAELAGRIPETLALPVSGAPYPKRGAMVVPSGIAQAPQAGPATHHRWAAFGGARSSASQHACLAPGRSHLAIHGQIGPSRHHHCPAHLAAEPPRARSAAWTFLRSLDCGSLLASERPAKPAGRIPETLLVPPLEKSLESRRELRALSRAGPAPTNLAPRAPISGMLGA